MVHVELKKIDPMSIAKLSTAIYGVFGIPIGIIMATFGGLFGGGLGFSAIIIVPIAYAFIGFVSGIIVGLLYNVAAKYVGGVTFDFEQKPQEIEH
ncbi:hypothetical protein CL617_00165 [archaeon]|nr:hypothetical protein [archaeon]|tara:strand:- start:5635 stop:5919 length:285 start_codon:yes stop_codon:yes gene_type:complete